MYKKQKGFTLVEMILVTAIIGILAGMVITVINIPRIQQRSRDNRRIGDLKRIQSALELYFSDKREYPPTADWEIFSESIVNDVDTVYMNDAPLDPSSSAGTSGVTCFGTTANDYGYYYRSDSSGEYVLGTIMEVSSTADGGTKCSAVCDSGYGCGTSDFCYCVQSPM